MKNKKSEHDRERQLQGELEDSAASVLRSGQRLADWAEEAGVRDDILEGTGDVIYEVALHQLQVMNRSLQSSFRLADALLRRTRRSADCGDDYEVVTQGTRATWKARVRNNQRCKGELSVAVKLSDHEGRVAYPRGAAGWEAHHARSVLAPGQATLMRVSFSTGELSGAYLATIEVCLTVEGKTRRACKQEFELHVVEPD